MSRRNVHYFKCSFKDNRLDVETEVCLLICRTHEYVYCLGNSRKKNTTSMIRLNTYQANIGEIMIEKELI